MATPPLIMPLECIILSIDRGLAHTQDRFGKRRDIPMNVTPMSGPFPRIGETWVIDKASGFWNFTKCLRANPPILTGTTLDTVSELINLLADSGLLFNHAPISVAVPPTGSLVPYFGSTVPAGYLLCDGAAYSRGDYFDLWMVLKEANGPDSYPFGSGNGTTTFNVPDMRGRFPLGIDPTGLRVTASPHTALGQSGGVETVTLTAAQMPTHTHVQNSHTHLHDPHSHAMQAHTHTSQSHSHSMNSHNHTSSPHTHTSSGHTHTQNAHTHDVGGTGLNLTDSSAGNTSYNVQGYTGTGTQFIFRTNGIVSATATENAASSTINSQSVTTDPTTTTMNTASVTIDSTTTAMFSATSTEQSATPTNQNTGGGGSHQNLPPYLIVNYLVKA